MEHGEKEQVSLYLLAGFATAPQFLESFRGSLHGILEREGFRVRTSQLLFPYGDWSRRAVPQLWEISRDMRLGAGRFGRSIGGRRVVDAIGADWRPEPGKAGRIVLIGHSGGGVAAVHAAWQLLDLLGGPPSPVVMIGSPRCRIPEELRASVLFVYAGAGVGSLSPGKPADGVSRLGTFGGWRGFGRSGSSRPSAGASDSASAGATGAGEGGELGSPRSSAAGSGAADSAASRGAATVAGSAGRANVPLPEPEAAAGRRFWPAWLRDKHAPAERRGVPIIGKHADYFREREPYINELGLTNLQLTQSVVWPWLRERI
ncbi:hypothetical protein [Paenibacillus glycinis]|uniref:Fungal lipase-like domain-containing protein n=1 Tax=Paenibacillus glycinis TaxID=2697035 RepID=A0ABW9XNS2_9BACL|nr:hypothetical protein [Paenibacillus glycinis]NBD24168.1 hypothetical protein [Paenibacillus glycinis]